MTLRIGLDLDGVIFNFTDAFARLLTKQTGIAFPLKDTNFPATWDWDKAAGVTAEDSKAVWRDICQDNSTFWQDLRPLDGAQETLRQVNRLAKDGHDVYFISTRIGSRAKLQTEKALYELGVDYPTVLISGNKPPVIYGLNLDMFIDDKPETVQEIAALADARHKNGDTMAIRGSVFLKSAPYNRHIDQPNVVRVNNPEEMLRMKGLWV